MTDPIAPRLLDCCSSPSGAEASSGDRLAHNNEVGMPAGSAGCRGYPKERPVSDGSMSEGSVSEGSVSEGGVSDESVSDESVSEGGVSDEIVEVRDYTIERESFEAYRGWARDHAAPWLKTNLDVIDFWVDDGMEALVSGSAPAVSPNGQPNVCWIIRWPSREARDEGYAAFAANPEWKQIWSKHPNPDAYLQVNVRFMRAAV